MRRTRQKRSSPARPKRAGTRSGGRGAGRIAAWRARVHIPCRSIRVDRRWTGGQRPARRAIAGRRRACRDRAHGAVCRSPRSGRGRAGSTRTASIERSERHQGPACPIQIRRGLFQDRPAGRELHGVGRRPARRQARPPTGAWKIFWPEVDEPEGAGARRTSSATGHALCSPRSSHWHHTGDEPVCQNTNPGATEAARPVACEGAQHL